MINGRRSTPLNDTPSKKIKLNEDSTLEDSQSTKTAKMSFMNKLNSGMLGTKKQEPPISKFEISAFELPMEYRKSRSSLSSGNMEEEENEEQLPAVPSMHLNRKFTCYHQEEPEDYPLNSLKLYRNSSTCDQTRQTQQVRLGDNIYLKAVDSKINRMSVRPTQPHPHHRLRLDQDYEIEQNLKPNSRHHASYICLNKLQRIFYYVKSIKTSWEEHQSYDFLQKLVSQQIKVYNSDPQSHFLRFYQSWFESNALYMTFQVAVESLDDATLSRSRLREIQVWDLLRQCCSALHWLSQTHELAHLNIKPGNIVKCQRKFKLVDPYCTKNVLQMYLQKEDDNWNGWLYLAPQIKNYSYLLEGLDFNQADIYSLGMCVIYNLLGERHFPTQGKDLRKYLQKHLHGYSPSLVRTLLSMVNIDPRKRPRAEEICRMESREIEKKQKVRRFSI